MVDRGFRDLVETSGLKIGTYIGEFATPGIGQILRSADVDFAFVDLEHSGFTYETLKAVLRYLHGAGVASLVRPASREYHDIARALDMGAQAVIPPMMTAAEAAEVAAFIKYPTQGTRGVAFGIAHDDYAPGAPAEKIRAANRKTAFMALIESAQGLDEVETIAATKGVDGLWIGHFDLSCSLGIPAEFDNPTFKKSVARIVKAARTRRKPIGFMAGTPADGARLYREGFSFVLYLGDVWLLQAALAAGARDMRAALASGGARRARR
jgi:2-dehydro-3-deoxyglucarate aldolase/4-hydroxy-2-oxoheptanedioate aldolase